MKRTMLPMPADRGKRVQSVSATSTSTTSHDEAEWLPSDSVAAFEVVVRETGGKSGFPISVPCAFVHQVATIVTDAAVVAREVERARVELVLRQVRTDLGVLLVRHRDYVHLAQALQQAAARDEASQVEASVLDAFITKVLPVVSDLAVTREHLVRLMDMDDARVSKLCKLGFLVYQTHGRDVDVAASFWFTVPNLKPFLDEVRGARKEFVRAIQTAKPHRELIRSKLLARRKFKSSTMAMEFHIRDAVGAGLVRARDTTIEGPSSLFLLRDKLLDAADA